jgi:hypothetical protein
MNNSHLKQGKANSRNVVDIKYTSDNEQSPLSDTNTIFMCVFLNQCLFVAFKKLPTRNGCKYFSRFTTDLI